MRLFEDEITDTIATDGPCEVLGVEERIEWDMWGQPAPSASRRFGVVVYRAKTRMHPRMRQDTGKWELPESATETRIICVRASASGTELPRDAGRFLGSFRSGLTRFYAFLGQTHRESRRPEASEGQKEVAAPAPARAGGQGPNTSAASPPGKPQGAPAPARPHNNGQSGRP